MNETKKTRKKNWGGILVKFAVLCFTLAVLVSLIGRQVQIRQKQDHLARLEDQLNAQNLKNQELKNAIDNEDGLAEYAERRAREDLDFAKPHERVFVDMGGE